MTRENPYEQIPEEKIKKILLNIKEVYFETSITGNIIYITPSVKNFLGYNLEETINKSIFNYLKNPEDKSQFLLNLKKKNELSNYELAFINKKGNTKQAIVNAKLIHNDKNKLIQITGSIIDTSENYKVRKALKDTEEKQRVLLENAGVQIIYTDTAGKIILMNRIAAEYLGCNKNELSGMEIQEVYQKNHSIQLIHTINQVVTSKKGAIVEIPVKDKRTELWFFTNIQPVFDESGIVTGVVVIFNDITDRKQAEREMQKLSLVIEQSNSLIIITNTEGIIEYVNQRFTEVTGYSFQDVHGKKARIFEKFSPGSESQKDIFKKLLEGKDWNGETISERKDGTPYWVKVNISPVLNDYNDVINFVIIKEDITSNKIAEKFEKQTKENLLLLNEMAMSILSIQDNEDVFYIIGEHLRKMFPDFVFALNNFNKKTGLLSTRYINGSKFFLSNFFKKTKLSRSNLVFDIGEDVENMMISHEFVEVKDGLYGILFGKVPKEVCRLLTKLLSVNKIYARGIFRDDVLLGSLVFILRKDQKYIENHFLDSFLGQAAIGIERKKMQDELVLAKNTAQEMNHLKTLFLSNMSHELRTPLNGILGFSELLHEQIDDKFKNMTGVIQQSGVRLLDTVNTILDFSTLEAENIQLNYSHTDVLNVIRESIRKNSFEADNKGLQINLINSDKVVQGYTVKNILSKITNHLLKNAIKFTNAGKITITVRYKTNNNNTYVIIEVKDTGIGIPKEDQENIFKEFRQGSEGFARKFEGTGLGLTICKKFTGLLGGELHLRSKLNKGSTFTLLIPLYQSDPNL